MVDSDSMGPGLQLVGARFSNFLVRKLSGVRTSLNLNITRILNGHISVLLDNMVWHAGSPMRILYADMTLTQS